MSYKTIGDTFWTDPGLKHLSYEVHSFLGYLITNKHAHYSGIYYLPKILIGRETRLSATMVNKYMDTLALNKSGKFYAMYDEERDIVWVKNMLRYQIENGNKKTMLQGTAKQLKTLHGSPLIKDFLEYYYESIQEWSVLYFKGIEERKALTDSLSVPVNALTADNAASKPPETPPTPPKEPVPAKAKEKAPEPAKETYGEFRNVKLTDEEYKKLVDRFGEKAIKGKIEELSGFIKSKKGGDKYKDHYATLVVWMNRAAKDKEGNMPERPEQKVCTKENPMPKSAKLSEWRHPQVDKLMVDDICKRVRCKHCHMDFEVF